MAKIKRPCEILGTTVYIMGAGASCHTGAPLLSNFLDSSNSLRGGNEPLCFKDEFDEVFDEIGKLQRVSRYVNLDFDNLEHIFSLAEMRKQLDQTTQGVEFFRNLLHVVTETLDKKCKLKWEAKARDFLPDMHYSNFSKCLKNLNEHRQQQVNSTTFKKDVIITFNYDVMLDHAMLNNGLSINYCLDSGTTYCLYANGNSGTDLFQVLKLHGSTNWPSCRNSQCEKQGHPHLPIKPKFVRYGRDDFPPQVEDEEKLSCNMVTLLLRNTKCTSCEQTLEPLIIPPTWSKNLNGTPLGRVWEEAVKAIENAFQLIVIGYSLPSTDTFFHYLITLGLASSQNLRRVVVINNDDSDEFKFRYKKVFSAGLSQHPEKLKFRIKTFKDFIDTDMEEFGTKLRN